jgi:hypothetical protein
VERLVRLRIEDDGSIEAANRLFEKGWVLASVFEYKGEPFRNQYLFLLTQSPEDEERERWETGEDDEDDKFSKGEK